MGGKKPSMGGGSDTCEGEKVGRKRRLQCMVKMVSASSVDVLNPRAPVKGVTCLTGTDLG